MNVDAVFDLLNALKIQQKLVEDRLEQLDLVRGALSDTVRAIEYVYIDRAALD